MGEHGRIRSDEACYKSSSMAVALAKQYGAKLHVLHLTSAKELSLFTASHDLSELKDKNITAEVCVHHLFFNDTDYDTLGSQIKCNPAVKSTADQHALLDAVRNRLYAATFASPSRLIELSIDGEGALSRRRAVAETARPVEPVAG